jgi:hypothetical protein
LLDALTTTMPIPVPQILLELNPLIGGEQDIEAATRGETN